MPLDHTILGVGTYSPREAARLVGTSAQEVLRWTRGSGPNEPLWKAHYQFLDDATELSFVDLIEVRVVKALRRAGVSLQAIRYAIALAEKTFKVERPLASRHFKVDGREILMDAIENDGELVSLSRTRPTQKVFAEIVRQSLNDLEYEDDHVARWRPASAHHVVLDPSRQFGTPILDAFGISTATIYTAFVNYADARYVAKLYEVPLGLINDAIRFEQKLDKPLEVNG